MSTVDLHRTAFDKVQREAGANWTDWEGWAWAADFGDPAAEHVATRTACNLWDESPLRKWDLDGPDALALADALFANDMSALEIGQVRYGPICDEQGKMIMDGTVFRLGDHHCLSITSYDSDLDWFRQVASDRGLDVRVEDRTAAMPHLQVQGPKAREVLGMITEGADVDTLRYFRFIGEGVRVGGVPVMLSRTGPTGELASSCTALRKTPRRCGTPSWRPAGRTASDRSASARSRRSGSSPGSRSLTSTTSRTRSTPSRCAWTTWSSSTRAGGLRRTQRTAGDRRPGDAAAADHAPYRRGRGTGVRRRGDP